MEHGNPAEHHDEHPANLPSGAMVREHWNNWTWFTTLTKVGVVAVAFIVILTMWFIV